MACVIGKRCAKHMDSVHGHEAEELRSGIEKIIESGDVTVYELQRLLDDTDARDSLAFLENKPKTRRRA